MIPDRSLRRKERRAELQSEVARPKGWPSERIGIVRVVGSVADLHPVGECFGTPRLSQPATSDAPGLVAQRMTAT